MPNRLAFVFLVVFAVIGVLAFATQSAWMPPIQRVIDVLKPQSETFTELYFEKHLELPTSLKLRTPSRFFFTIHNLENKEMVYPVEVQLQNQDNPPETRVLATKTVTLKPGEQITIPVELTITSYFSNRVKVRVLLTNLDQSIHFWVNLNN